MIDVIYIDRAGVQLAAFYSWQPQHWLLAAALGTSQQQRGSLSLCTMAWPVIAALMLALYPSSAAGRAGGLGKRPVMGW